MIQQQLEQSTSFPNKYEYSIEINYNISETNGLEVTTEKSTNAIQNNGTGNTDNKDDANERMQQQYDYSFSEVINIKI